MDPTLLLSLGHSLHFMDTRLMLQMLVNFVTFDVEHAFLAPTVNAHIFLELELLRPEAHHAAVPLVHLKQIVSE